MHVEYINREKAFAKCGGCIFQAPHLPKWAHDYPTIFLQAADEYEGVGNRRYMEIEFALPNKFKTLEQYRQIIDSFIAKHLPDNYYAYAIHNKIGVMSEGQHHPHVHIMLSERIIDDVKKTKERTDSNFFKYPAQKIRMALNRLLRKAGIRALKNSKWARNGYLTELQAEFAQIQNEILEQNEMAIHSSRAFSIAYTKNMSA